MKILPYLYNILINKLLEIKNTLFKYYHGGIESVDVTNLLYRCLSPKKKKKLTAELLFEIILSSTHYNVKYIFNFLTIDL